MAKLYEPSSEISFTGTGNLSEYAQKVQANEMNVFKSVYLSLLGLGEESVEEKNLRKHIRITNFVALITFAGSLLYLSLGIFWEKWDRLYSTLALTITCFSVLVLNNFGKTLASRVVLILGFNLLVFLNTLMAGPNVLGNNYLYVALVLPFLIFDVKKTRMILAGIILPLILGVASATEFMSLSCSSMLPFTRALSSLVVAKSVE